MDRYYPLLLAPWVHASSLVWCGFGLWLLIQPSMLAGPFAALIVQRENARKFGITPALMDHIVGLAKEREECVHYDDRIARIGAGATLLTGLIGLFTQIDPAIIASIASVICAWTTALYLSSTNRTDGKFIASLDVRLSRLMVIVLIPIGLAQIWLLTGYAIPGYMETPMFTARMIVQLTILVPYIFFFAAINKCNRDLRRAATSS